jgi:hypothetical protein
MNKSKSHLSEESADFSKYNIEELLLNEVRSHLFAIVFLLIQIYYI